MLWLRALATVRACGPRGALDTALITALLTRPDALDTTLCEQRIDELLGDRSAVPGSVAGAAALGRPASADRRRNATRHAAQRGAAMLAAPLQEEIMSRLLSGGGEQTHTRDRAAIRRPQAEGEPLYTVMYSRLYDAL